MLTAFAQVYELLRYFLLLIYINYSLFSLLPLVRGCGEVVIREEQADDNEGYTYIIHTYIDHLAYNY